MRVASLAHVNSLDAQNCTALGPLQEWLQDLDLADFRKHYLGAQPIARPGSARAAIESCSWPQLDELLHDEPEDLLVVSYGKLVEVPPPRTLGELRPMFRLGLGLAVRSAERHCAAIATLCDAFARELPGEQRVIVFATPADTHGFGWHYDAEDVFIVQTAGDKEYFFRRNSVSQPTSRNTQPDFTTHRYETTPIMSCRLLPGDWLYLPRGYWHVAHAHTDALSLSIGVFPS